MSANIVLTGLMGAGKSSVGKVLSEKLKHYSFVDIDEEIEKKEGISISEIFEQKSEEYFREIETEVIKSFSEKENGILSIGGGAFEKEINRKILLNSGKVFYLYASADVLYERIKTQTNRPLLRCDNPKEKLEQLLAKRENNYQKANYIINTENKTKEEIADEILRKI